MLSGRFNMGCGSSKSAVMPVGDSQLGPLTVSARTPQGLAFEVPLHDPADEDSLIRKHPPRRLQRLEEQPVSPPTLQELQDKLAEAQQRRLQILSQRVASARSRQKLKRSANTESRSNGLLIEQMYEEPSTVAL